MKRTFGLLALAAMIVSACDAASPVDADAAAPGAGAEQFPTRAAGMWRTTSIASGYKREVQKACFPEMRIDEAQQLTPVFPAHDCDTNLKVTEKSVTVEQFCRDGSQRLDSYTVITGDFEKRYVADSKFRFTPAVEGKQQVNVITTAERIGDC